MESMSDILQKVSAMLQLGARWKDIKIAEAAILEHEHKLQESMEREQHLQRLVEREKVQQVRLQHQLELAKDVQRIASANFREYQGEMSHNLEPPQMSIPPGADDHRRGSSTTGSKF